MRAQQLRHVAQHVQVLRCLDNELLQVEDLETDEINLKEWLEDYVVRTHPRVLRPGSPAHPVLRASAGLPCKNVGSGVGAF